MKISNKFFVHIVLFFLIACSNKNQSGYEKIEAVVTSSNGNLYVLTETLDYEFPKSGIKDIKNFFELAPVFFEINQPISSRMWVKERSVDFSFDDAILRIYKEDSHKFSRNDYANIKSSYATNNKAKNFLKYLEKMVKEDRTGKLAIKRENSQENIIDYNFKTNNKTKSNIRGRVVDIIDRKKIIEDYQSNSNNFKNYRINIFYEPSLFKKGFLGKKIEKEMLISGNTITLDNWKVIPALKF